MSIGEKIHSLREERKLTQKELADKCGFSQSALTQWENNKRKPKIEAIHKLCSALDCDIADFSYPVTDYIIKLPDTDKMDVLVESCSNQSFDRLTQYYELFEWCQKTYAPLNEEGRKKVAEYAEVLAETNKFTSTYKK